MNTLTWTMALLMGFTGSLHCAGMCGPIIWIMPFQAFTGAKKLAALALYHASRITVYALLAIILHSFRSMFDPKIQQYISIILGCSMLVIGILTFLPGHITQIRLPWADLVKKQLGKIMGRPGMTTMAAAGFLNGLLPCGLVYMALSASFAAHTTAQAAGLMYAFGVGTMPMLVSISLLKTRMPFLKVKHAGKFAPMIVFCFGCLFLLRGMNLDIPYLSPKVEVTHNEIHSCCSHKR